MQDDVEQWSTNDIRSRLSMRFCHDQLWQSWKWDLQLHEPFWARLSRSLLPFMKEWPHYSGHDYHV